MTADEHFPRARRLLRPTEFARVYSARCTAAQGPLVLYAAPRDKPEGPARLGLSVSRRIGNAVIRNRWKRRLREAFRRVQGDLSRGNDYIIVVRSGRPEEGEEGARRIERMIVQLAGRTTSRPRGRER